MTSAAKPPTSAGFVSSHIVSLAARFLPAGQIRDRYRQEFLAELYGRSPSSRVGYALRVLTRSPALRSAVRAYRTLVPEVSMATPRLHKPLLCRTHLHHRWTQMRNPDGENYLRCSRCGTDLYDVERSSRPNIGGNLMGLNGNT
jgi:hypothetical protein